MIGSSWKGSGRGPGWKFETRIDDEGRYEGYGKDPEGAHEKLGNGTYSFFDSKESLMYTMRSQFTNEWVVIRLPMQIDGKETMYHFRYGETDLHIAKECVRGNKISFILPQDSIFTIKFGEVWRSFSRFYGWSVIYCFHCSRSYKGLLRQDCPGNGLRMKWMQYIGWARPHQDQTLSNLLWSTSRSNN